MVAPLPPPGEALSHEYLVGDVEDVLAVSLHELGVHLAVAGRVVVVGGHVATEARRRDVLAAVHAHVRVHAPDHEIVDDLVVSGPATAIPDGGVRVEVEEL